VLCVGHPTTSTSVCVLRSLSGPAPAADRGRVAQVVVRADREHVAFDGPRVMIAGGESSPKGEAAGLCGCGPPSRFALRRDSLRLAAVAHATACSRVSDAGEPTFASWNRIMDCGLSKRFGALHKDSPPSRAARATATHAVDGCSWKQSAIKVPSCPGMSIVCQHAISPILDSTVVKGQTFYRAQAIWDGRVQVVGPRERNHPDCPLRGFVRCEVVEVRSPEAGRKAGTLAARTTTVRVSVAQ
jgi:hypothetical protein